MITRTDSDENQGRDEDENHRIQRSWLLGWHVTSFTATAPLVVIL
jgi:hypothetical protein